MSRVFLCGDTHGYGDIDKLNTERFPEQRELTKNDYVIILGDFGLLWKVQEDKSERYWLNWLNDKTFTTLVIDGNHENFDRLEELEDHEVDFCDKPVGKMRDSVFHIRRGSVLTVNDKKLFCMGGGESIDKFNRSIGVSWWPQEIPTYTEMYDAIENMYKYGKCFYAILTHVAPSAIKDKILFMHSYKSGMVDPLERFFNYIDEEVIFRYWYFGHYHGDQVIDDRYFCLYHKIRELPCE